MLNRKLKSIVSLVSKTDKVIDIGCDHAYLAIYLKKQNLVNVYASDISKNVVERAKKNIEAHQVNVPVYLANGFQGLPVLDIDTAVISGMGTNTILDILKYRPSSINKLIISSNNNYYELRKKICKLGFYIEKELVVFEKDKYYPIIVFKKGKKKLSKYAYILGTSNDYLYYEYLKKKELAILEKIPHKYILKRFKSKQKIRKINKILKRKSFNYE